MAEIYHLAPDEVKGDTLLPLSQLQQDYPNVYNEAKKKYEGREHLLKRTIPRIDCEWQDVLHLTPIHPRKIKSRVGLDKRISYFTFKVKELSAENAALYTYESRSNTLPAEEILPLKEDLVKKHNQIPQATKNYYKQMKEQNKQPLLFVHVPHVLYQGTLSITDKTKQTV